MTPEQKAKELYELGLGLSMQFVADERLRNNAASEWARMMCLEFKDQMNCTHIGYGKTVMNAYFKSKSEYWRKVETELQRLQSLQSAKSATMPA